MSALPSSGSISISQIRTELVNGSGSLRALSADAGKSTPDSMSEFRGYQLPNATINLTESAGGLYDGCGMSMDSTGYFDATDPDWGSIGPWGGAYTTNSEGRAGTYLTFGGASSSTVHGRTSVHIVSESQGYGATPCQPIYCYINVNGSRVANTQSVPGYTNCQYTFTATAGTTYNVEIGLGYGSV
jgi:hypothetical protein